MWKKAEKRDEESILIGLIHLTVPSVLYDKATQAYTYKMIIVVDITWAI